MLSLASSAMVFTFGALDKTVTMYHVNPLRFGPVPRNMDAADAAGDIFFELFEVLTIPLACDDPTVPSSRKPFECRNLETNDPTTVVNKVELRIDSNYSNYAMCNIGNKQGKDPFGRPCPVDEYCCYCSEDGHHFPPKTAPCNATVGKADLYSHFGEMSRRPCHKDYDCWTGHAAAKLDQQHPGFWYSPLKLGDCSLHPAGGPNCTWIVEKVVKIVNGTCHSDSFFGAVQRASPESFDASCSHKAPNASDPCWVRGFYTAVLGADAAKPSGWKIGGLPLDQIIALWEAPFASDDPAKGGCPGLPIPPSSGMNPLAPMLVEEREPYQSYQSYQLTTRQRRWRAFARRWYGLSAENDMDGL